jgi:hypothetical protein
MEEGHGRGHGQKSAAFGGHKVLPAFCEISKVWAFAPSRYNALTLQEGGSHDGRYVAPRFSRVQGAL